MTRYGAVTQDGKGEAVEGLVIGLKGVNAGELIKNVKIKLTEIQATLPKGVTISPFYDRAQLVDRAVGTVSKALLEAAVLVVALFFLAPLFLTKLVNTYLPNSVVFNIVEGVIRLGIFIAYLKVMSLLPDIKRVFTYHGAEHKTVNAYEAGVAMEVDAIRSYSTAHVRCGTSFLFTVLVIAIVVFSFVGRPALWLLVLSRVLLIPVIAAIGYEVTYVSARHTRNWLVKIILAPGLLLQSLTTGEPDDRQMEVAIAAMSKAVEIDATEETAPASP